MIKNRFIFAALLSLGLVCVSSPGHAQVVLDGSVGTGNFGDLVADDPIDPSITYNITQGLGDTLGDNLFHSFDMFDVNANEIARFSGAATIQNIISRITGGSQSGIDGTIRSSIVGADVWLINPAGFVFGSNAVLDTTGSFHVGAADFIQFFDGRFGADLTDPANTMLSAATPSAFGFVSTPTGRVDLNSADLLVAQGESISLVGADVRLDSSRITAPGGQITLDGSGTVSMRGSSVLDVSDTGAGSVFIRGGQFLMGVEASDDEEILANSSDADGGVVDINVSGQTSVRGEIRTDTSGTGNAADISISAGSFLMLNAQDGGATSIMSTATSGTGNAGSVSISTDGVIDILSGRIDTSTSAGGMAGDLSLLTSVGGINLDNVILDTSGSGVGDAGSQSYVAGEDLITTTDTNLLANAVGIANAGQVSISADNIFYNGTIDTSTGGSGAGGDITLSATDELIIESGFITALTTSDGNAGNITLDSSTIEIRPPLDTNIASISADTSGDGDGGDIVITADRLSITENTISANTSSTGDGGDIVIQINGLPGQIGLELIDASIEASATGFASGDAGTITINGSDANNPGEIIDIQLSQDSRIVANTTTDTSGRGGGVDIRTTGAVRVYGDSLIGSFSEVNTGPFPPPPICPPGPPCSPAVPIGGLPGTVTIVAESLDLGDQNGAGQILASTESGGMAGRSAGSITIIVAGDLEISGPGSEISTTTSGQDNAAGIQITADNLTLSNGGVITASTEGAGNAGDIDIAVVDTLNVDDTSSIQGTSTNGAIGTASNISISGAASVIINGNVSTSTSGFGAGGTISIDNVADTTISGQLSSSTTGAGAAGSISLTNLGNLTVDTGGSIESRSQGVASGAAGSINIAADSVRLIDGSILATTQSNATGNAEASIDIAATDSIDMLNSVVEASTTGASNAGDISLAVTGTPDPMNPINFSLDNSTISASTTAEAFSPPMPDVTGDGGEIAISTNGTLRVSNNSRISSSSGILGNPFSAMWLLYDDLGSAGSIEISASDFDLVDNSRISVRTESNDQTNLAGSITVDVAGAVTITDSSVDARTIGSSAGGDITFVDIASLTVGTGGSINSSTFSDGAGGTILFDNVDTLTLDGGAVSAANFNLRVNESGLAGTPGQVVANVGDLIISGGSIETFGQSGGDSGAVTINADNGVYIYDGGRIATFAFGIGAGSAGSLTIRANSLSLGLDAGGIQNGVGSIQAYTSSFNPANDAGRVDIQVTDEIQITGVGSRIDSDSRGAAPASNVDIVASRLSVSDGGTISSSASNDGAGGTTTVNVDELIVSGGGSIRADTSGGGTGGSIIIGSQAAVANVTVTGTDSSISANTFADGMGGSVTINVGNIAVSDDGQISAVATARGDGGGIEITADRLSMTESTISANTTGSGTGGDIVINIHGLPGEIGLELVDSSIQASSLAIDSGDAGNITITAADPNDAAELIDIQLSQNSRIVTNTTSASLGSAGAVVIQATGAVRVFGDSEIGSFSEVFVSPPCPPGTACTPPFIVSVGGLPGSVTITADALSLGLDESGNQAGPGRILASTDSDGDGRSAGLITINVADEIQISGPGSEINTTTSGLDTAAGIEITSRILTLSDGGTISASTTGEGGGGSIDISADTIFLQDGGEVSVTASGSGAAGVITMTAAEQLRVTTGSSITASSVNSGGGEINIFVDDFIFLSESNISASSGGNQSGGNITIGDAFDPQLTPIFFIIVDSNIIAEGGSNSAAGNINIFADNLFIDEKSTIEATNELNVNSNIADMTATIVVVEAPYLNVLDLLEDRCAATAIQDRSSFVIEGIYGLQPAPDGFFPSPVSVRDEVESTTDLHGSGTSQIDMAALATLAEAVGC